MTFLNVDVSRFKYLLSLGVDDFELRAFFKECRRQLIMSGAKVQNLPHGPRARIHALACQLPRSTDKVLRQWFAKRVTIIDPDDVSTIVDAFTANERSGEQLTEALARRYSRSCLVHLFCENPPDDLLTFLRTPIGETLDDVNRTSVDDEVESREAAQQFPENLPLVFLDLAEGKDAQEHLDGLPLSLATFVSGIVAVLSENAPDIREVVEGLPDPLRTHLEQFAQRREARKVGRDHRPRGLEIMEFSEYRDAYEPEEDAILAYCTNDRPNAVFVRPIAVVRGNQLEELPEVIRKTLFPDTGDVIAFVGPNRPKPPRRGQIGVWQVAEHETDKQTRFHLQAEKRPVFEVRPVPFASIEYDSVREFLKTEAERSAGSWLQPSLFLLQDGLIIGGRSERPDFTNDQVFESGLVYWNALTAFRLEGRLFVLGPTRHEDGVYECASLAFTARKLFRSTPASPDAPARTITKAQLRELLQSLEGRGADLDALRVQRIKDELERLENLQEAIEALVSVLLSHHEVKRRIDAKVEEQAAAIVASRESLHEELIKLQRQRTEVERKIQKQQEEHRRLREDTARVVRETFDKACKGGLSTIAEVAVFQALAGAPSSARSSEPPARSEVVLIREVSSSGGDPRSLLRTFGITPQRASAFVTMGECAIRCGLMVGVRGLASRAVVTGWAGTTGQSGVLVDATVGLIGDVEMRELLARRSRPDVVALLDANLSALDIYARPIADLVLERIVRQLDTKPAVLFSVNDGVGSLPIPFGFERLSVFIDLEAAHQLVDTTGLADLRSRVLDTEGGSLYKRLWRPAADKLSAEIQQLDPENEALVLSVL